MSHTGDWLLFSRINLPTQWEALWLCIVRPFIEVGFCVAKLEVPGFVKQDSLNESTGEGVQCTRGVRVRNQLCDSYEVSVLVPSESHGKVEFRWRVSSCSDEQSSDISHAPCLLSLSNDINKIPQGAIEGKRYQFNQENKSAS